MINMLFLNSPQKYFHKLRVCGILYIAIEKVRCDVYGKVETSVKEHR